MKVSTVIGFLILGAIVGGLVATNPTPIAYQAYATEQASLYLNEELCNNMPEAVADVLQGQCAEVVAQGQPQIPALIRNRTERLNLWVCSIYRTSLGIPGLDFLPSYEVKTLGIMGRFIPLSARQLP